MPTWVFLGRSVRHKVCILNFVKTMTFIMSLVVTLRKYKVTGCELRYYIVRCLCLCLYKVFQDWKEVYKITNYSSNGLISGADRFFFSQQPLFEALHLSVRHCEITHIHDSHQLLFSYFKSFWGDCILKVTYGCCSLSYIKDLVLK